MKVITLNQKGFVQKCDELISKIDTKQDLIIGVLNGAGFILDRMQNSTMFNFSQIHTVKFQREATNLKNNPVIRFALKYLPYQVLNEIRILESNRAKKSIALIDIHELSAINIEIGNMSKSIEIKNILIIDDAIDTGRTMFVVKNNLSNLLPRAKIKTAVISWTIESSIVKPDYYLYRNILVRFPWSIDYKGKDFEEKSFSS